MIYRGGLIGFHMTEAGPKDTNKLLQKKCVEQRIFPFAVVPMAACRALAAVYLMFCACFPSDQRYCRGGSVRGFITAVNQQVAAIMWCFFFFFLTDESLLLSSTGLISLPSTSSCVLKEMEILFTHWTNTHICSLSLLFLYVDMHRLVVRLVASDRLQEVKKNWGKKKS